MSPMDTEDVTGTLRQMVSASVSAALQPFIGQPMSPRNIEAVKAECERVLWSHYAQNDVHFPWSTMLTARRLRELCSLPESPFIGDDAVLYLTGMEIRAETDPASRSLQVRVVHAGEWRWGDLRQRATEAETSMAVYVGGA